MENKRLRAKGDREASVVGGGFEIRTVKSALCVCYSMCACVGRSPSPCLLVWEDAEITEGLSEQLRRSILAIYVLAQHP